MPYALRKAPNRDLYFVFNKETKKKYSREPLPKDVATAQLKALYRAEGIEEPQPKKRYPKKARAEAGTQLARDKMDYARSFRKTKASEVAQASE